MSGGRLQAATKTIVRQHGEQVTVTRRAATDAGTATTQSLYCLPQSVSDREMASLVASGTVNLSDPRPFRFVFAGDADVRESVDSVAYGSQNYRVFNTAPQVEAGTVVSLHAYGVRE